MRFKRAMGFKAIANGVFWIMLVGGVVFTAGFRVCLMIARQSDDITMLAITYRGNGEADEGFATATS